MTRLKITSTRPLVSGSRVLVYVVALATKLMLSLEVIFYNTRKTGMILECLFQTCCPSGYLMKQMCHHQLITRAVKSGLITVISAIRISPPGPQNSRMIRSLFDESDAVMPVWAVCILIATERLVRSVAVTCADTITG